MEGVVRSVFRDKGFGFIRTADGKEFFFHRSETEDFDTMEEKMAVEFEPKEAPKGPRATGVRLVD